LRAGDEDGVAYLRAEGEGEFAADDDRCEASGDGVLRGGQICVGALLCGLQKVANLEFVLRDNSFDEGAPTPGATGQEDLAVEAGGYGFHAGDAAEAVHERTPVVDTVPCRTQQLHVGGGAYEATLKVSAHAGGNGECDDQRGHTGSDTDDGDGRDEAYDGLAASSAKIARGDEELESDITTSPTILSQNLQNGRVRVGPKGM
jgi:hypothetical protein